MADHLLVTKEDGIATLTMNRPEVRNALSIEMRNIMFDAIDEIEHDDTIRCVVLRGAGGHFMSGGDIKNFNNYLDMSPKERQIAFERRVHGLHPMIMSMKRMAKPVLASVEGAVAGAGLSFMTACDLAIAADTSYYAFSYINIGASPDGSGTYHLPRLVGVRKALELAIMADRFDAKEALDLGIVNWVVPEADIAEETQKLARKLASKPNQTIGAIKEMMYASHANSLETQLAMEAKNFAKCAATDDWAEGVRAFLEKRKPEFTGK